MKTKNTLRKSATKAFRSAALILPAAVLSCFLTGTARGQNLTLGASINSIASGSSFGSSFSPQLSLHNHRHTISAGINVQSRQGNYTGVRGRYEIILNPLERFDIFLFYDVAFHRGALLSKYAASMEGQITPEFAEYYNTVRLNTTEHHGGFGLSIPLMGSLKVYGAAGIGHYTTSRCPSGPVFQYREGSNCSVILMMGLKMDIKTLKTSRKKTPNDIPVKMGEK